MENYIKIGGLEKKYKRKNRIGFTINKSAQSSIIALHSDALLLHSTCYNMGMLTLHNRFKWQQYVR